jgi:2-methylcitrate dehydratase PrpD
VNEWPWAGSSDVFFHAAFAARSAVSAVLLARTGAFASPTAIDGRAGLFAAYGKRDQATSIEPLGDGRYEIMSVYWKPAPACNYVQTPCQAALVIAAKGIRAADIEKVRVKSFTPAIEYPGCNQPGPFASVLAAKMSIQYAVAATLVRGAVEEANYARLDDPEILRLARSMELASDTALEAAYPEKQGVEIIVRLKDGREIVERQDALRPFDAGQVRARLQAAVAARSGEIAARGLLSAIDALAMNGTPEAMIAATAEC